MSYTLSLDKPARLIIRLLSGFVSDLSSSTKIKMTGETQGSPHENVATSIWALPVWGGGVSTLARMVWGTYLEKNCPSSNGHLLDCGGVKMLARMVWGTYAVKIEVQVSICFC